ncbi:hypothetical protein AV530_013422 [Patagioenas fasciata monilis]|uniref:Uncharacterized protein n=1 Tax=Patagioenas fasciata monilis TaxID=372326 RepID=A0A1V4JPJ8_PATFA|nr:hypothetical protein AV530_013422 [Patagioenas fasciata monilis]
MIPWFWFPGLWWDPVHNLSSSWFVPSGQFLPDSLSMELQLVTEENVRVPLNITNQENTSPLMCSERRDGAWRMSSPKYLDQDGFIQHHRSQFHLCKTEAAKDAKLQFSHGLKMTPSLAQGSHSSAVFIYLKPCRLKKHIVNRRKKPNSIIDGLDISLFEVSWLRK